MVWRREALYPGVAEMTPRALGVGAPLASVATGREVRVVTAPLGATAPRPGGGGGAAPPRPLRMEMRNTVYHHHHV